MGDWDIASKFWHLIEINLKGKSFLLPLLVRCFDTFSSVILFHCFIICKKGSNLRVKQLQKGAEKIEQGEIWNKKGAKNEQNVC